MTDRGGTTMTATLRHKILVDVEFLLVATLVVEIILQLVVK